MNKKNILFQKHRIPHQHKINTEKNLNYGIIIARVKKNDKQKEPSRGRRGGACGGTFVFPS